MPTELSKASPTQISSLTSQLNTAQSMLNAQKATPASTAPVPRVTPPAPGGTAPQSTTPPTNLQNSQDWFNKTKEAPSSTTGVMPTSQPQTFESAQKSAYENLIGQSKGYLDSINTKAERAIQESAIASRGIAAAGGMGGSPTAETMRAGDIEKIQTQRQSEMGQALSTIQQNATAMAQTQITTDIKSAEAAYTMSKAIKEDAQDIVKTMAAAHTDWNKFKTEQPQDYNEMVKQLGGDSNYADALFAQNIPKQNVLQTTFQGSKATVIYQDPQTGAVSAHSYDIGMELPKSWVQDKIGTNATMFHTPDWNPNDPSTFQIFAVDPLTGLPTNQIGGNENPTSPVDPNTITSAVSNVASVAGISDPTIPLSEAIATNGIDSIVNGIIRNEGSSPAGVENNPGNILFAGQEGAVSSGKLASDSGKPFASFKTPEAGRKAIADMVNRAANGLSPQYGETPTVASFINKYTGQTIASSKAPSGDSSYSDFLSGRTPEQSQSFNQLSDVNKSNVSQLINGDALLTDLVTSKGVQGSAQKQKLLEEAKKVDPSFSENTNKLRYEFMKKWNDPTNKLGVQRNSINTAMGHLADVKKMTTGMSPDDWQIVNKTKNWWDMKTGNPEINKLQFGLDALATEIATVYKGGVPGEDEIAAMKSTLGTQLSSKQFEGVLNTVSEFLGSKITSTRYQYKSVMGKEYNQSVIDPDKKQALLDSGIDPEAIAKEKVAGQDTKPTESDPLGLGI